MTLTHAEAKRAIGRRVTYIPPKEKGYSRVICRGVIVSVGHRTVYVRFDNQPTDEVVLAQDLTLETPR